MLFLSIDSLECRFYFLIPYQYTFSKLLMSVILRNAKLFKKKLTTLIPAQFEEHEREGF